jgi:hypothetical protein
MHGPLIHVLKYPTHQPRLFCGIRETMVTLLLLLLLSLLRLLRLLRLLLLFKILHTTFPPCDYALSRLLPAA